MKLLLKSIFLITFSIQALVSEKFLKKSNNKFYVGCFNDEFFSANSNKSIAKFSTAIEKFKTYLEQHDIELGFVIIFFYYLWNYT